MRFTAGSFAMASLVAVNTKAASVSQFPTWDETVDLAFEYAEAGYDSAAYYGEAVSDGAAYYGGAASDVAVYYGGPVSDVAFYYGGAATDTAAHYAKAVYDVATKSIAYIAKLSYIGAYIRTAHSVAQNLVKLWELKERFTGESDVCYQNNIAMRNYLDPTPTTCVAPRIQQGSTCYLPCPTGKVAYGWVCVDECPATHPMECGVMMCSKDEETCNATPTQYTKSLLDNFDAAMLGFDLMYGNASLVFLDLLDKTFGAIDHFAYPFCTATA